jgi:peptide deformylase
LHEFDHLMGVTFDQRASILGLAMAKDRRKKKQKKFKSPA